MEREREEGEEAEWAKMMQGPRKTSLSVKGQRKLYFIKGDAMISLTKRYYDLLILISIVIIINIWLYGCGGIGKTTVLKPNNNHKDYSSLTISEGNSTVNVPPEIKDLFKVNLNKFLIEEGKFKRGTGLKIIYSYIQFNPGYQAAHYLIMGGMGEGSITINVIYIDHSGNEIATIQAEEKISIGYPIDVAIKACARQVVLYTEENFLNEKTNILVDNKDKKLKAQDKEINNDIIKGKDKMKSWWVPAK